jgi:general stress protein 26
MPNPGEMQEKFWKSLKSDRTIMIGLAGVDDGLGQPMTAQVEGDESAGHTIWMFAARNSDLVEALGPRHRATAHFAAKGHDLFAAIEGELVADNDRAAIERLWNPFVAAWFEGGKDDPNLQLLRFEPDQAQVWLNENSLFAGVRMLLGRDPKKDYADKSASVRLS